MKSTVLIVLKNSKIFVVNTNLSIIFITIESWDVLFLNYLFHLKVCMKITECFLKKKYFISKYKIQHYFITIETWDIFFLNYLFRLKALKYFLVPIYTT